MASTANPLQMSTDARPSETGNILTTGVVRLHQRHAAPVALGGPDQLPARFDRDRPFPLPVAQPRLLITPSEAAFALSISTRKLWSLTNAGQIPCVRLGRAVRYSPADLQEWIQGQTGTLR